ncbi:SHOCT domain-containing protein [Arthrobacter psychrolactophilus]
MRNKSPLEFAMAFGRRNRRPSLLGTAARTAVIAGTATAASNAVNAKAANQQAAVAPAVAAPLAAPAVPEDDLLTRLERLAALHASGALSDSEFAAVKATLIP